MMKTSSCSGLTAAISKCLREPGKFIWNKLLPVLLLLAFNCATRPDSMHYNRPCRNYISAAATGREKVDTGMFDYTPYFFAVIVNDLDSCEKWYRSVFGLTVTKRMNEPAAGFKVIVLESPILVIELIEDRASVKVTDVLAGQPAGAKIKGLFKIGFHVQDMNACLQHFSMLKINAGTIYKDKSGKRNFLVNDPDGNIIQLFE